MEHFWANTATAFAMVCVAVFLLGLHRAGRPLIWRELIAAFLLMCAGTMAPYGPVIQW